MTFPGAYWSRFGVGRAAPSAATFSRVLARVDADVLDAVLGAWTAAAAGDLVHEAAIAVDGKSARGARRPDGTRVHLFAAVTHGSAIPLGQVTAATKGAHRTLGGGGGSPVSVVRGCGVEVPEDRERLSNLI